MTTKENRCPREKLIIKCKRKTTRTYYKFMDTWMFIEVRPRDTEALFIKFKGIWNDVFINSRYFSLTFDTCLRQLPCISDCLRFGVSPRSLCHVLHLYLFIFTFIFFILFYFVGANTDVTVKSLGNNKFENFHMSYT